MSHNPSLDGILITWGDRLFNPGNRIVQVKPQPRLGASGVHQRANAIRQRIQATVVRRAPQVMVKVTGRAEHGDHCGALSQRQQNRTTGD